VFTHPGCFLLYPREGIYHFTTFKTDRRHMPAVVLVLTQSLSSPGLSATLFVPLLPRSSLLTGNGCGKLPLADDMDIDYMNKKSPKIASLACRHFEHICITQAETAFPTHANFR
jgi:3-methyladenine DNA glycosylase Mpg